MTPPPPDLRIAALATSWGTLSIVAGERGVWACEVPPVPADFAAPPFRILAERYPIRPASWLRDAVAYARSVLEGRDPGPCPPPHPAVFDAATPFRRAVWQAMRRIPRGRTLTYGELARRAGRPGAARAAGGACGANPLPLFIPCHRVVAAGNRPGGFSSGLAWKRRLLAGEGAGR